jgi:uncharacterized membrane protein YiaA
MSERADKVARGIKSFVENPVTNLVKGVALLLIGLYDASHTLREDVTHGQLRVGHGLIIIGLFSILGAVPQFIEGLEAGSRYLELRGKKEPAEKDADNP